MKFKYLFCLLLILAVVLFLLPFIAKTAPPANAVKFVILRPDDSTVSIPVTVTIEAQKSNNQVDTAYQNDVTLLLSGSAVGGGLVDIVNGIGTVEINDAVAETVILSLSDTQTTGLDVSSIREVDFEAAFQAIWHQTDFWFRDDDGTEALATGYGTLDTSKNTNIIDIIPGAVFRLRFGVRATAENGIIAPRLEFKQGIDCGNGTWATITPTSGIFNLYLSGNFSDGDITTKQITNGSFVAGKILEITNPGPSLSLAKNKDTEYEWSIEVAQDIAQSTNYSFRVTNNGVALNDYEQCPLLTTYSPVSLQPEPPEPGFAQRPTTVTFLGKAFPQARVFVVNKDMLDLRYEHIIKQETVVNQDGSFQVDFVGILQSQHSFGLYIKDKDNKATQTKFFNINTRSNAWVVKNIAIPPTIGFVSRLVTRGNKAIITGYAAPESSVIVEIDGIIKKQVKAKEDGFYQAEIATSDLDFGNHQVRAKQILAKDNKESDFSPTNALVVSRLTTPETDLSGDGKVNIADWSIFLFQWGSKDTAQKKIIDFNQDNKIDISDFSIFIKNIRQHEN